ncbi:uncharacterized protein ATNIH1004_003997 [Aspergillus tanneri]|uniref:Uncharacterized protein n=1 Tax=Aspergillus tanneri TaxID=1220188 RepID=A0A5M9MRV1_9EURO|nr:uncharacterized protein ATNIH1004_003997 [Aspergillus tanneri]KAA8648114.1 hypothetical protein ATNIH1004_003997 [Aspergillus tanneri]
MSPPSKVVDASQGLGSSKYNPVLIDCGDSPYGSRENPIYIVDWEAIYGYPKRQSTEPGSPEPPIHVPAPGGAVLVDASVQQPPLHATRGQATWMTAPHETLGQNGVGDETPNKLKSDENPRKRKRVVTPRTSVPLKWRLRVRAN